MKHEVTKGHARVCACWGTHAQGTSRDEYGRLVLGDIIRTVDGVTIKSSSDLYRVLDKAKVRTQGCCLSGSTFSISVTECVSIYVACALCYVYRLDTLSPACVLAHWNW